MQTLQSFQLLSLQHTDTYAILMATCPVAGTQTPTHLSFQLLAWQTRAPETPGVLSSHRHLLIHPHRTDRPSSTKLPMEFSNKAGKPGDHVKLLTSTRATGPYLASFSYLVFVLSQITLVLLLPTLVLLLNIFYQALHNPKNLSLHPIMAPMSLSGWWDVCNDPASFFH